MADADTLKIEIVERPDKQALYHHAGKPPDAVTRALLATAESGQAIRVVVNGQTAREITNRLSMRSRTLKSRGFRVVTRQAADGSAVYAWVTPITTKNNKARG